jgi:hypothetical protein
VDRAVIAHAHGAHARMGHGHYLAARSGVNVLKSRLGDIHIEGLEYGARIEHNGVTVSLYLAGHVLGSHARAVAYRDLRRATPFGFALMVERFREKVTTSFGAFTGGFLIAPEAGDAICVSAGEAVHLVR